MKVLDEVIEAVSDGAEMAVLRKRPAEGTGWPQVVMFHDGPGIRRSWWTASPTRLT